MSLVNQKVLNAVAGIVQGAFGGLFEGVRYEHRTDQTGDPVSTVDIAQVRLESYSAQDLLTDPQIQRTDRRARIAVKDLTQTPSQFDTMVVNQATWRVISFTGGPGTPWWLCQVRQVK